ncbi:MAG: amidohydrolase family protein [Chloroflexi bacterium]|nr:amidohydrolase family protein [Chloroflexota bacterium]
MAAQRERPLTVNDLVIVDCDVHANDPPEALAPYCDEPWRVALEHLGDVPRRYLEAPGYAPATPFDLPVPGRGLTHRTVTTADQMREDLDAMSIDIAILFPDFLLRMAVLPQADFAAAVARAFNAWLAERWTDPAQGLYGTVLAAPQDPEDAAREIRKYGSRKDFVGVFLPTCAVRPLWGHTMYDPIFEAAQETGCPVMLHSVGGILHTNFPFNTEQFATQLGRHSVEHGFALMANIFSMIETGMPVRFPDLNVVFTEGGVSWVPYVLWHLDKEYHELRHQAPLLTKPPSHYIREFYFCTQPVEEPERPQDLVTLIDLIDGKDHVVFASDWPHHDFDHPREVMIKPFPAETKRKIMGETALKLFDFATPSTNGAA